MGETIEFKATKDLPERKLQIEELLEKALPEKALPKRTFEESELPEMKVPEKQWPLKMVLEKSQLKNQLLERNCSRKTDPQFELEARWH